MTPSVTAGWACCRCSVFNGLQRKLCKQCLHVRCEPLAPDTKTGEVHETYESAYADQPSVLAQIYQQLRRTS